MNKPPHLLLAGVLLLACMPASAAPRPNIILCMADDMGWGDPSYASKTVTLADGSPHPDQEWINTPTLDDMAANGLRFDRFYSASAVCSPTRASCLTGRNPIRVGVPTANSGRLGFDETPLSEVLSGAGYLCGHFGKWHLGSMTTLRDDSNRGGNAAVYSAPWHHRYNTCFATESKVPTYHPYRKANNSAALPTSFSDTNFYGTSYWRIPATWNETSGEGDRVPVGEVNNAAEGDDSKLIVDHAISFMQNAAGQGKPFFLVVWFHTPHKPVVDPDGVSSVDSSDAAKDSIEDMDTALGRLRAALIPLGARGNTMIWVTSDNGPENGVNSPNESSTTRSIRSGRFLERKRSLHEGGVRVPGILEWPDVITSGRVTDFPAVTSDYYPTILDYLCLSVPNQKPLDGISLRPLIEGTATTRSKPIGFQFSGDKSWVNHQYKLINDGSGWELYDLINIPAGEDVEQTPIATAADINSQPQAIQDVYDTMLAEYTAWDASMDNDTAYVHSSQPAVVLNTATTTVSGPFTVTAAFSEDVTGLNANEFAVSNGTATSLSGAGTSWTATVSPTAAGAVTIALPEGSVLDPDGNVNGPSNELVVTYAPPPGTHRPPDLIESLLPPSAGQTVDSTGLVPADGSNNLAKFTAGNTNDGVANPFTTTLYVRSNTGSDAPQRTVRAFIRFDLSDLNGFPILAATLTFEGHSLNDNPSANPDLQVIPLATEWAESGSPAPTFNPATTGTPVSGGGITDGLDPGDHTRTYRFDITTILRNWTSGASPNHGLLIQLSETGVNNGVGIRTSGAGAIELAVQEAPLNIINTYEGPASGDLTIEWNSLPGMPYRVETNTALHGPWDPVIQIDGATAGSITTHTEPNGIPAPGLASRQFYRVAYPAE